MGMIFFSKYKITIIEILFNSLRMSDAYMRHQPRPSLVQLMACRQAIIWTNAVWLSIRHVATRFNQIVCEI